MILQYTLPLQERKKYYALKLGRAIRDNVASPDR